MKDILLKKKNDIFATVLNIFASQGFRLLHFPLFQRVAEKIKNPQLAKMGG